MRYLKFFPRVLGPLVGIMLTPLVGTARAADPDTARARFWTGETFDPGDSSAQGAPASGIRAVRPWAIPKTGPDEFEIRRAAGTIARDLSEAPFDVPWSDWVRQFYGLECQPFRGPSWMMSYDDYWLFDCRRGARLGTFRYLAYFVDEEGPPRVGRMEWGARESRTLDSAQVRTLYQALLDSLSARFRRVERPDSRSPAFLGWGSHPPPVEFASHRGRIFAYEPIADPSRPDSTFVFYLSNAYLEAEQDTMTFPLGEYYFSVDSSLALHRGEVAATALRDRWPDFASILDGTAFFERDTTTVLEALRAARSQALDPSTRDALVLAAHLWLEELQRRSDAYEDTAAVRRLQRAFGPFGGGFHSTHYAELCYDGGVARSLWQRPCDNRWTELAFLRRQQEGWLDNCEPCTSEGRPASDLYPLVIERGEAHLRDCPNTTIRWELLATIAAAHETAWSLSKASPENQFSNWAWYALEGPAHRTRALEIYRRILGEGPPHLATPWLRGRLRRLELDVDTSYRPYWCFWD